MTTKWRWYVAIIVPQASREEADAMASFVAGEQQASTFSVELSPSGAAPATHYACGTWATDEWITRMGEALSVVGTAKYYRMDQSGTLVASSSQEKIGMQWSWGDSIADAGLKVICSPPDALQG